MKKETISPSIGPSISPTETKLFFVVVSNECNNEIFETLEMAKDYLSNVKYKAWISIAMVRNYYKESSGWNYDDFSDTFDFVKDLK